MSLLFHPQLLISFLLPTSSKAAYTCHNNTATEHQLDPFSPPWFPTKDLPIWMKCFGLVSYLPKFERCVRAIIAFRRTSSRVQRCISQRFGGLSIFISHILSISHCLLFFHVGHLWNLQFLHLNTHPFRKFNRLKGIWSDSREIRATYTLSKLQVLLCQSQCLHKQIMGSGFRAMTSLIFLRFLNITTQNIKITLSQT